METADECGENKTTKKLFSFMTIFLFKKVETLWQLETSSLLAPKFFFRKKEKRENETSKQEGVSRGNRTAETLALVVLASLVTYLAHLYTILHNFFFFGLDFLFCFSTKRESPQVWIRYSWSSSLYSFKYSSLNKTEKQVLPR
jgi:hypothetical protein